MIPLTYLLFMHFGELSTKKGPQFTINSYFGSYAQATAFTLFGISARNIYLFSTNLIQRLNSATQKTRSPSVSANQFTGNK